MMMLRRDLQNTPNSLPSNLTLWLTLAYSILLIYVTLHPIGVIRWTYAFPFAFLFKPWSSVGITAFDVWTNVAAYFPLGFGLAWILPARRWVLRVGWCLIIAASVAISLESLQSFSPQRVASVLDALCNIVGAIFGAIFACLVKNRHSAFIYWFTSRIAPHRGPIWAVIALWVVAQLHPQSWALMTMPLATLTDNWLPSQQQGLGLPLNAAQLHNLEMISSVVVVSGIFALLRLGLNRHLSLSNRGLTLTIAACILIFWQFLASCLQYGWGEWHLLVSSGVLDALWIMLGMLFAYTVLPTPWVAVAAVLSLALHTALAQMLPAHPYATTAALWQQGRLVHLYGLTGLISALWPILALSALILHVRDR